MRENTHTTIDRRNNINQATDNKNKRPDLAKGRRGKHGHLQTNRKHNTNLNKNKIQENNMMENVCLELLTLAK